MRNKCKGCPKREDCPVKIESCTDSTEADGDKLQQPLSLEEYNNTLNLLLQFEQSICRTINFTLNGRNAGLQWIFYKIMSNKFAAIAKEIKQYLVDRPEADEIDWDTIKSIDELSDEFTDDDTDEGWFKGDIKGV